VGQGAQGRRGPPGVRDSLARALGRQAIDGASVAVPNDYALWLLGIRMGVPAWVFEGHPIDSPPVEWVIRSLEFARMEASAKNVTRG
jgi:hypothetical protein